MTINSITLMSTNKMMPIQTAIHKMKVSIATIHKYKRSFNQAEILMMKRKKPHNHFKVLKLDSPTQRICCNKLKNRKGERKR